MIQTLHAPHGASPEVESWLKYECQECSQPFETLFEYNRHRREKHDERGGLRTEK